METPLWDRRHTLLSSLPSAPEGPFRGGALDYAWVCSLFFHSGLLVSWVVLLQMPQIFCNTSRQCHRFPKTRLLCRAQQEHCPHVSRLALHSGECNARLVAILRFTLFYSINGVYIAFLGALDGQWHRMDRCREVLVGKSRTQQDPRGHLTIQNG